MTQTLHLAVNGLRVMVRGTHPARLSRKMTKKKKSDQNSTDATIGQSLKVRVELRKAELEKALASPATSERVRGELTVALGEVIGLLTGDLDRIPKVVGVELNAWLEANKHVDEQHHKQS